MHKLEKLLVEKKLSLLTELFCSDRQRINEVLLCNQCNEKKEVIKHLINTFQNVFDMYMFTEKKNLAIQDRFNVCVKNIEKEKLLFTKQMEIKSNENKLSIIKEIIEIAENTNLSIKRFQESKDKNIDNILSIINILYRQIIICMKKFGVDKISVKPGDIYDFNLHNACSIVNNSKFTNNSIIEIVSDGYIMNGLVIKPTSVVVNKLS